MSLYFIFISASFNKENYWKVSIEKLLYVSNNFSSWCDYKKHGVSFIHCNIPAFIIGDSSNFDDYRFDLSNEVKYLW